MADSAIARRYARAYFELAQAASAIEPWHAELRRAVETLSGAGALRQLTTPRLSLSARVALGLELLDGCRQPVKNLVRLLIERRRIGLLAQIQDDYGSLSDRARGIVRVTVTSAVALDARTTKAVAERLSDQIAGEVKPEFSHDPQLIGGLVIRIGDRVIDGSVRTHLQQLQAALA